jgi:hypothetical protein
MRYRDTAREQMEKAVKTYAPVVFFMVRTAKQFISGGQPWTLSTSMEGVPPVVQAPETLLTLA